MAVGNCVLPRKYNNWECVLELTCNKRHLVVDYMHLLLTGRYQLLSVSVADVNIRQCWLVNNSCVTNPKYLKSLKPKNTNGYDEISSNLLKIRAVFISSSLNFICNASLSLKNFPQCWILSSCTVTYKGR